MNWKYFSLLGFSLAAITGCWDEIDHQYDPKIDIIVPDAGTGDSDSSSDEDAGGDTDTDTDTSTGPGQGNLPDGWENFGAPCEAHEDCTGYPRARCVDSSILGIINAPGGYCTACCDSAGEWCADGIQCIGLNDVYLICAATCDSSDQCREDEGWTCRPIPELLDTSPFPGDFCLPDDDHIEADTDVTPLDLNCDWPWVEE